MERMHTDFFKWLEHHEGRQFAAGLGYPIEYLDRLPLTSVQAFTGVSNVSIFLCCALA